MIKTISLIKRRPDISRDAFREHYETVHAPLALPFMTGLSRYVRYHITDEIVGDVGFDVLSAFWYQDPESVAKLMETLQGEAGKPILEDELTFMDKPANRFFPVSERMLIPGEEGDAQIWVLVRKPEGLSRYDASQRLADQSFPDLFARVEQVEFALLRDAFPVDGGPLPYNAVLQFRAGADSAASARVEAWSIGMVDAGFEVVAVETKRHETDLDAL